MDKDRLGKYFIEWSTLSPARDIIVRMRGTINPDNTIEIVPFVRAKEFVKMVNNCYGDAKNLNRGEGGENDHYSLPSE